MWEKSSFASSCASFWKRCFPCWKVCASLNAAHLPALPGVPVRKAVREKLLDRDEPLQPVVPCLIGNSKAAVPKRRADFVPPFSSAVPSGKKPTGRRSPRFCFLLPLLRLLLSLFPYPSPVCPAFSFFFHGNYNELSVIPKVFLQILHFFDIICTRLFFIEAAPSSGNSSGPRFPEGQRHWITTTCISTMRPSLSLVYAIFTPPSIAVLL